MTAIVAIDLNGAIGYKNELLYRIPDDLKRFKELTTGNIVVMGRKTMESIGKPLPKRENIVVSKSLLSEYNSSHLGYTICSSIKSLKFYLDSIRLPDDKKVYVIGGEQIYNETYEAGLIDEVIATVIYDNTKPADAYFPIPITNPNIWMKRVLSYGVYNGLKYRILHCKLRRLTHVQPLPDRT